MNGFKKLIEWFKKIVRKNEKIEENEIYNSIQTKDIIWAKRYSNENEKNNILEGHQEGPFLVLGKCEKGLICSHGTGTMPLSHYSHKYIELSNAEYSKICKDTYFRTVEFELINEDRFIKPWDVINDKDYNAFILKAKRERTTIYKKDYERYYIDLILQPSDLIAYNFKSYLVLNVLENQILCVPFNFKNPNVNKEQLDKIDFSKMIYLDKNIDYKYISVLNEKLFYGVLIKQNKYLENLKNQSITQRGSVINKDNLIYYIYGEIGNLWQTFNITDENCNNHTNSISICQKCYYTNYENINIDKKASFETIGLASEEEIEMIKNKKKSYKKVNNKNEAKIKPKKFQEGDIIYNKNYDKNERFIVINRYNTIYNCISINNIINGIYEFIDFQGCDIYKSPNKSTEGIIWLDDNPFFDLRNIGDEIYNIVITQQNYLNCMSLVKTKK